MIYAKIHHYTDLEGASKSAVVAVDTPTDGFDPFDVPDLSYLYTDGSSIFIRPASEVEQELLASAKAAALTAVDIYHADTVQMLAGNPTQVEKDTWTMKLDTAKAILAGTQPSPEGEAFIVAAGMADAQVRTDWASRVLGNAAAFAEIVGVAEALRDQAKAAINAATTQAELDAALASSKAAAEAAISNIGGV